MLDVGKITSNSVSWVDRHRMCNEYENPAALISYFSHATESSRWQRIRQCDVPEGGMRAQDSEKISEG